MLRLAIPGISDSDPTYPVVLSVPEAADLLGHHRSTTLDDIHKGRFPVPSAILTPPRATPVRIAAVPLLRGLGLDFVLLDVPNRTKSKCDPVSTAMPTAEVLR